MTKAKIAEELNEIIGKIYNGYEDMEELINVVVNNGLGVASFIALIIFIFKYQEKITTILEKINTNQSLIQSTLSELSERIEKIEYQVKEK